MIAQLLPFALVGVLACGSIALSVLRALPAIRLVRQELAACADSRELRYTVRELRFASRVNVVELPVRMRPAPAGQRAAA